MTREDIDLESMTISVSKTYQRIGKEDIITPPKTPKSNRVVALPQFLCDELQQYLATIYDQAPGAMVFPLTKYFYIMR